MSQNEEVIDNIEDENVCEMHSNESQENSFED